MNLLAKKLIKKYLLKPGLMLLIPVFFGCETQEDLGIQYDLGSDASTKFVELTLPSTNVFLDSLRTDDTGRILVGSYSDPLTGDLRTEGYFQYIYESGPLPRKKNEKNLVSDDTLKLDSLVITLETSQIIPLRGTSFQEFSIYELQSNLQNDVIYLSTLDQSTSTQIGSFSKEITPDLDTIYRVKIEDDYALEFFDNLSDVAGDTTKNILTNVFNSLGIVPDASSQSIASFNLFSDTSRLIMYSSPIDTETKDTTYLTSFSFSGASYSFVERTRTDTDFADIEENSNFDIESGITVIDPLAGLSTAFSLAPLEEFLDQENTIIVSSASVFFEYEINLNRDTLINFMEFIRKPDNRIYGPALESNSFDHIVMTDNAYINIQSDPVNGILSTSKDKILSNSTLFFQQLNRQYEGSLEFLSPSGNIKAIDDLVLVSPDDVTLQQTIFKKDGVKLRIYYTEVEQ